jgi:hypothetical protein
LILFLIDIEQIHVVFQAAMSKMKKRRNRHTIKRRVPMEKQTPID